MHGLMFMLQCQQEDKRGILTNLYDVMKFVQFYLTITILNLCVVIVFSYRHCIPKLLIQDMHSYIITMIKF